MTDIIQEAVLALEYGGIGVLMIVVAPELVMPLAGYVAAEGHLSLVGVITAGTVGASGGLTGLYVLARWLGEDRFRVAFHRYGRFFLLRDGDLDSAFRAFARYGSRLVFFGRCLPTVRSLISIPAGLVSMPLGRYLLLTVAGSALWNVVLGTAGYALSRQRERLLDVISTYELAVMVALVAVLVVLGLHLLRRRILG